MINTKDLINKWSREYKVKEPKLKIGKFPAYNYFTNEIYYSDKLHHHNEFILAHEFSHYLRRKKIIQWVPFLLGHVTLITSLALGLTYYKELLIISLILTPLQIIQTKFYKNSKKFIVSLKMTELFFWSWLAFQMIGLWGLLAFPSLFLITCMASVFNEFKTDLTALEVLKSKPMESDLELFRQYYLDGQAFSFSHPHPILRIKYILNESKRNKFIQSKTVFFAANLAYMTQELLRKSHKPI